MTPRSPKGRLMSTSTTLESLRCARARPRLAVKDVAPIPPLDETTDITLPRFLLESVTPESCRMWLTALSSSAPSIGRGTNSCAPARMQLRTSCGDASVALTMIPVPGNSLRMRRTNSIAGVAWNGSSSRTRSGCRLRVRRSPAAMSSASPTTRTPLPFAHCFTEADTAASLSMTTSLKLPVEAMIYLPGHCPSFHQCETFDERARVLHRALGTVDGRCNEAARDVAVTLHTFDEEGADFRDGRVVATRGRRRERIEERHQDDARAPSERRPFNAPRAGVPVRTRILIHQFLHTLLGGAHHVAGLNLKLIAFAHEVGIAVGDVPAVVRAATLRVDAATAIERRQIDGEELSRCNRRLRIADLEHDGAADIAGGLISRGDGIVGLAGVDAVVAVGVTPAIGNRPRLDALRLAHVVHFGDRVCSHVREIVAVLIHDAQEVRDECVAGALRAVWLLSLIHIFRAHE